MITFDERLHPRDRVGKWLETKGVRVDNATAAPPRQRRREARDALIGGPKPKPDYSWGLVDEFRDDPDGVTAKASRVYQEASNAVYGALPRAPFLDIPVGLSQRPGQLVTGQYGPKQLSFNPNAPTPHLVVAHELGHAFDNVAGRKRRFPASVMARMRRVGITGPELNMVLVDKFDSASQISAHPLEAEEEWLELDRLLAESRTLSELEGVRDLAVSTAPEAEAFVSYMLAPHEVFARAFSQYVAKRSMNGAAGADLRALQDDASGAYRMGERLTHKTDEQALVERMAFDHMQWQEDEWPPIHDAFDKLFTKLGWTV